MRTIIFMLACLLTALLLITGCSDVKRVKASDSVKIHYTGKLEDGTVFDSSLEREPIEFKTGSGSVIPGFDNGVMNMAVGETKTVTIPPGNAYGEKRGELVMNVHKNKLPENIIPEVDKQIMMPMPDGRVTRATITDISEDSVTVDANHPLAGKTLIFELELMAIN